MERILISRTDSIGDVILTLPLCGVLKASFPESHIDFIGKKYTHPVIKRCRHITDFYDFDDLHKSNFPFSDSIIHVFPNKDIAHMGLKSKIPFRIGTSHRLYHWLTCNKLVNLGRKNSDLHEARLNLELAKPLGINQYPDTWDLWEYYGWNNENHGSFDILDNSRFNLVFHIKSKGSAKEWEAKNFLDLANELDPNKFQIILTGTKEEGDLIKNEIPKIFELPYVVDTTGQFSLDSFIDLIEQSDGLLAASTGPLHIAAASGINALGLYPYDRPMHAGRWAPIGKNAEALSEKRSNKGRYLDISIEEVKDKITNWLQ